MENIKTFLKEKSAIFPFNLLKGKSLDFFFPCALVLAIVPLIVHIAGMKLADDAIDVYGKAIQTDLFSQRKAYYLMIFSILIVITSILSWKKLFNKKDKIVNAILISSSVFLLFALLSTIFSAHKQFAIYGAFDRAEGIRTIICYMIVFIYSIYSFKISKSYKYFIIPIMILVVVSSFLGVFQFFGHDLITTKLGAYLVFGDTNYKASVVFAGGKLYGTLFHYDYMGSFAAIVLPILLSLTIFEKKIIHKVILGVGTLLSIWLTFGSGSRAGIVGVAASIFMSVFLFGRAMIKYWKAIAIIIISIFIIIVGLNIKTEGVIFERLPSLAADISHVFKDTSDFDYTEHVPIKDVKQIDGKIEIVFPTDTLKISYEDNHYIFKNSKDEIVPYTVVGSPAKNSKEISYTTADDTFKNISFTTQKINNKSAVPDYLYFNMNGQSMFNFRLRTDNTLHLIDMNSKIDIDLAHPETVTFFTGKEKLGSARGYIWSRSIPLLKNNLIIGSGPDTCVFQFPQNDLIGKYYAYDTPNMLVDKPHNLFLQIGLNNGVIALIAFLAIMFIYIIDSIKLYAFKKDYNTTTALGAGICLGVIGYLFTGLFNDSIISVAPVFWIVLGVGVSINYSIRKEHANKHN